MLLALETATNICSVAFCNEDGDLSEKRTQKQAAHSEKLFLFIEELMDEHDFRIPDLSGLLVSEGPGSYTGLRIGASAVKGLLFQTKVPLYGVNTLASFAFHAGSAETEGRIHSIIDARRKHVYHQSFQFSETGLTAADDTEVFPIETFERMAKDGDMVVGTGISRLSDAMKAKTVTCGPGAITAKSLITLYQSGFDSFFHRSPPRSFEPKYLTSSQVN